MPRLVRRPPLLERIKAKLDPYDFFLWVSEELDTTWLEHFEKEWALPTGLLLNLVFMIARANSTAKSKSYDDVFGDDDSNGLGLWNWLASFIVLVLSFGSIVNAAYTFWRKRRYRLFEANIDAVPSTPSAHRVRVKSQPISSSPLRFLSSVLGGDNAEERAHPDATRDVWEINVWDPLPVCLRLFTLFSPGHVLIYWLFLPTTTSDPRPSTTIMTSMLVSFLLSIQLSILQSSFSQQTKDAALIQKEVMHEYDTKYVHPRTRPLYRDVGTQFSEQASYNSTRDEKYNVVETYKPMFIINRGFSTSPNPNYNKLVDPNGPGPQATPSRTSSSIGNVAPISQVLATPSGYRDSTSPVRQQNAIRQPQFRQSTGPSRGDGGSLGIYSHAQSPLRKSASTHFDATSYSNDYARERSPEKRPSSPLKRSSVPAGMISGDVNGLLASQKWGHLNSTGRRESGRF